MTLKLYVWEGVLVDYTSGMVCVLANSLEEAFQKVYEKDGLAWSELQGMWEVFSWDNPEIEKLRGKHPKENLTTLQRRLLDNKGIKVSQTAIKPRVITKSEAFVVHGGG